MPFNRRDVDAARAGADGDPSRDAKQAEPEPKAGAGEKPGEKREPSAKRDASAERSDVENAPYLDRS